MASLVIHNDALGLGICHPVACWITNVVVRPYSGELDEDIARFLDTLRHNQGVIFDRPEVAGFHGLARALGYSDARPAGHHRLERLRTQGFKPHNNLVDAYNLASIEYCSSVGMHDVSSRLNFDLHVYRARGGERIVPLSHRTSVPVAAGDLVYGSHPDLVDHADPGVLLAALGRRDVDSETFKVTENTTTVLLVALGNSQTSERYNRALCNRVVELVSRTCPSATATMLEVVVNGTSLGDQVRTGVADPVAVSIG